MHNTNNEIVKESPLKLMVYGNEATVLMRELPQSYTLDIRAAPDSLAQLAIAQALGVQLPLKTGEAVKNSQVIAQEAYILCLAPGWWLAATNPGDIEKLTPLKSEFHFSAVEVSGQRTAIEIHGPNARHTLTHLWEQDLRDKSFPVQSVSQGLMAKAPVILLRNAPSRYQVIVRSSFAKHVWMALTDAAID